MKRLSVAAIVLWLPAPRVAWACTVCDSDASEHVRTAIFNDQFWPTLAAVAAPFPVLLLAVAVYHVGLPTFGKARVASSDAT